SRMIFRIELRRFVITARRRHYFQSHRLKRAVQAVARLLEPRPRFQSAHQIYPPDVWPAGPGHPSAFTEQYRLARHPDCDCGAITHLQRASEGGWSHADDRERRLIEFELLADNGGVRAKPFLPKLMAEYDHGRRCRAVVRVRDRAPQHRLYAQPVVIAAGNGLPSDDFGLLIRHHGQSIDGAEGEEIAERVVSRGGARLTHLLDDVVAERRGAAHACRR